MSVRTEEGTAVVADLEGEPGQSASVGLDPVDLEVGVPVGGTLGLGWWKGRYDDAYALGRFASLGVDTRFDYVQGGLRATPLLEVRRGYDLFVVKPWFGAALGAEVGPAGAAPQLRATGGVKWRFNRYLGVNARLGAGAALVDGAPEARVGLAFAVDWSRPFRDPED